MATNYQAKVLEAEAEIEKARIAHNELQGMLVSFEEEYDQLEESSEVNIMATPVGSVREAVTLSTRLAIEGPALRQTIKELRRRVSKSSEQFSNLYQQRDYARSRLAGAQAAKMLATSEELAKTEAMLSDALALWNGIGAVDTLAMAIQQAHRTLKELGDQAKSRATAG